MRVDRKRKQRAGDISKGILDIECERDWSVSLGATLDDATDRKLKTIFIVSRIFSGKPNSVILFGSECAINPQNLIKIIGAIFEKQIFSYMNYP